MNLDELERHSTNDWYCLIAEVKRLRDLVDFAIAMIDSNDCAMGEEEQADLERHLRSSRDSERTDWTEED